ncbi:hypothetical protein ABZ214_38890 [Streptomyces iakyrus]|uniref:hypothetical protein n=1 Tax=Streptomyces iakyrus TaxID=68219 RepID=UPI0033B3B10A
MLAAVVLLAVGVLVHAVMPHHAPEGTRAVAAMAPATEPETRKADVSAAVHSYTGTGMQHHEATADLVAVPPRAEQAVASPAVTSDAVGVTVASVPVVTGAAHPRTARDCWNPGAGLPPDSAALQTFRC